jgi:hypothetical protein
MNGSTGAIAADCNEAHLAGSEHGFGTGTVSSPWPLQTRLELAAHRTAPGVVRGHVRAVAYEWGLAGLADTAELLASEIATNAVLASQRLTTGTDLAVVPVIQLWVRRMAFSWSFTSGTPAMRCLSSRTLPPTRRTAVA